MSTMRAVVYGGKGDIAVEERPIPAVGPDDLLLSVETAGVCGSDVAAFRVGPETCPHPRPDLPVVLGHEFAGSVVGAGRNVVGYADGDQVVVGAGLACGTCVRCAQGRTNLCVEYRTLGIHVDGGLAEFVRVPHPSLSAFRVDERLTPDAAALAQPMAIAEHAVARGAPGAGETTVVVGVGGIGAFIVHAAVARGAHVIAVDADPQRLELARALGAAGAVRADASGEVLERLLRDEQPGCAFDVTGVADVVATLVEHAPRGARITLVGVQKAPIALPVRRVTLDELTLIGTVAHVLRADLPRAVELVRMRTDWSDIAPVVRPLDDLVEHALAPESDAGRPIKSLFDPRGVAARSSRWT